jgi:hypothetical protein
MSAHTDETPEPTRETKAETTVPRAVLPLQPAAPRGSGVPDKDPIELARERAQQKAVEQLQRRVEALEAAAAAEPVTAPSPLQ